MQLQHADINTRELTLPISEEAVATIGLAVLALWNAIIYYFGFVKPASIYEYYLYPYIDGWFLQKGGTAGLVQIILLFVTLGISYYLSWRLAKRVNSRVAWTIMILGTVVSATIMLFMVPYASNDIYDNIIHGRILSIYHANPFKQIPNNFTQDIFTWYAGWPNEVSAYGPLWELLGGITTGLVHSTGIVENVIAFKMLNGLFFLSSILAVSAILRKQKPELAFAGTLLLAWNPVMMFETFGNAHNDIVMVFFIIFAIWAITEQHYEMALVSLMAGALVKYIPLLLIPAAGLIALRELPTWGRRIRLVIVSGAFSAAMIVLTFAPFWTGVKTLTIQRRSDLFTASIPDIAYNLLSKKIGVDLAHKDLSMIAAGLTLTFALWMGYRAMRDRSPGSFAMAAFSTLTFYIVVTCLWYQPWYSLWLVALVPLVQNRYASIVGIVAGFAAMGKHFIWVPLLLWKPSPAMPAPWPAIWLAIGIHSPVWIAALYGIWRTYRKVQEEPVTAAEQALQPVVNGSLTASEAGSWVYWPTHLSAHKPELQEQETDLPYKGGD
jgi:hypothetical protein